MSYVLAEKTCSQSKVQQLLGKLTLPLLLFKAKLINCKVSVKAISTVSETLSAIAMIFEPEKSFGTNEI